MSIVLYLVITLVAYLLGSISFSVIFGKKFAGVDVREKGSKNAGSTNVLRVAGKKAAACALVCDILKGVLAVLVAFITAKIAGDIVNGPLLLQMAAVAVILGHMFPVFFKFKGGKGVATSLGILLIINWQIGLICLVFAIVLIALTKMVSVGSMGAAILFPVLVVFINQNYLLNPTVATFGYLPLAVVMAILVIYNHRTNIQRLLNGTENKISFKSK